MRVTGLSCFQKYAIGSSKSAFVIVSLCLTGFRDPSCFSFFMWLPRAWLAPLNSMSENRLILLRMSEIVAARQHNSQEDSLCCTDHHSFDVFPGTASQKFCKALWPSLLRDPRQFLSHSCNPERPAATYQLLFWYCQALGCRWSV